MEEQPSPSRDDLVVAPPESKPRVGGRAGGLVVPRSMRFVLMGMLFAAFFLGSPVLALVVFPLVSLFSGARAKERTTRALQLGMKGMAIVGSRLGIAHLDLPRPAASVPLDRPYVMISNHPTYIDMLIVLGSFEGLTCVTNGRWWKHWALGRLLRATNYLPGPGSGLPESEDVLSAMVAHLEKGHPLLVFPEGQRSLPDKLRRFRRGAVEAAVRARVPIVPLFLEIDRPYLTKNVPITRPPSTPPTYRFHWLPPILPDAHGGDAKEIHKALELEYEARFEALRAQWAALSE